jgi:hypothetical protein
VKNAQLVDALGAWGSKDVNPREVSLRLEVEAMAKELAAVRADKVDSRVKGAALTCVFGTEHRLGT